MIPNFWSLRAHILFPREKSFLGVFCTYSPVSDFSRQNLCVRSSAENLNHIIPAKYFVLHSLENPIGFLPTCESP